MKIFSYKTRFFSALFIILLSSCSKDFLDKNPTDQPSTKTFYTSKNSIDMALTACYSTTQDVTLTVFLLPAYDCMADNGMIQTTWNNIPTLTQGPITPTSGGYIDMVYSYSYRHIARYNIFLKTLSEYQGADVSNELKLRYEAEARLLRAMRYFELYKFYGSVPLVTEPLTMENQYQPKVEANKILEQINADIDFSIANLADVSYAGNVGHLVKASGQVLKSRVLLFDAYNDDRTAKSEVMSKVKAVTSEIISKNYYSIAPSYRGLFCGELGKQEGNPEFIFSVKYLAPNNVPASNYSEAGRYISSAGSPGGALIPLKNFANEYEFNNGTPFSVSNPLYDATNVYKNRDARMGKTLFTGTVTYENGYTGGPITPNSPTGYSYYKHIQGSDAKDIYNSQNFGSDWPLMRYAEVLLMYAESANEVDGPSTAVYNAVNQIRARGDILMPPLIPGLSKDQMRVAIRHERRIELAFEGFRYDDVKRWKIAETLLNMPASESVISKSFAKKNYHLPLPQAEIDISQGVLIQNPDYQ